MIFRQLMSPGLWLMRRSYFGPKMLMLSLAFLLPSVIMTMHVAGVISGLERTWVLGLSAGLGGLALYLCLALYLSFSRDMAQVVQAMAQLTAGDLRLTTAVHGRDELAELAGATLRVGTTVSSMVANVRSNAAFVAHSGKSMAAGHRELSDRTEQQAANLEQTAASVDELSSTVQDNAQTALRSNEQAARVRDVADQGVATMAQAIAAVEAIQSSAKRMDEIVNVIDGLAFQTNILALNAAVEAARAGESGRGFAVVASEVRSLAQRSAESAKEIRLLIGASTAQVASSVQTIQTAGTSMTQIVSGIRDVAANMAHISTSSAEQSNGLQEISSAVRQLDVITQQNAQMVEQAVNQSNNLEGRVSTLLEAFAIFRLQQGCAEEAMMLVEQAVDHLHRSASRETFLRDISDPAQGFHDRDMYVFVLDRLGTYLAFGGNPAKVGTRVQSIAGIDGQGLVDAIVAQASFEPGWVEYDITNPLSGKVQTKMSFVLQIEDWFVGCGVYKNLLVS